MIISLTGLFAAGYLFVLVVDPYGIIPISFSKDRGFATDPRFFLPNLAKRPQFDSAIIGTSTVRLLNPKDLNPLLNGRFVNLALNAAFLFEQEAILDVFLRHHSQPKFVIFGVDHVNFFNGDNYAQFIGGVPENFPVWLYDESFFNDLLPYNWRSIQHAVKQLRSITGMNPFKYRSDGYEDFTKRHPYDIDRVRNIIYGSSTPQAKVPVQPPVIKTPELLKTFQFPAVRHLDRMLGRLPDATLKIVIIPPFHHFHQATPGSTDDIKWEEFKRHVVDATCRYENSILIDYMIKSPITTADENFLDQIHYTVPVAKKIARSIAREVVSQTISPNYLRYCTCIKDEPAQTAVLDDCGFRGQ